MKFKLGSDFYKALALFSQAGCPFTQAGSLPSQAQTVRPSTTSSAFAPGNPGWPSRESLKSIPSTAGSDQRTLVRSLATSLHSSSRPSTSSSSTWTSDPGPSSYSRIGYDTGRQPLSFEKPLVSPFFTDANAMNPSPLCSRGGFISAQGIAPRPSFFPSSSDPLITVGDTAVSIEGDISHSSSALFASRPSTAPAYESPRLSQMLPPKRELPFKVSGTALGSGLRNTERGQADSVVTGSEPDGQFTNQKGSTVSMAQCSAELRPTRQKKPPAKRTTRAARATRSAAATTRSCKKSSVIEFDSPVPSVEELLNSSRGMPEKQADRISISADTGIAVVPSNAKRLTIVGDDIASQEPDKSPARKEGRVDQPGECLTQNEHSEIDTQALLARVDEHQLRQSTKRKVVPGVHEDESSYPPSKRVSCQRHPDVSDGGGESRLPNQPSLVAAEGSRGIRASNVQDDLPLPQAMDAIAHQGSNLRINDDMLQSIHTPLEEVMSGSTARESPRTLERPPLADISNIAQQERSQPICSGSMRTLMNNPIYAESPKDRGWADQSPAEQDAALETWMCEQLESESFLAFTKKLEGMWQRIFFGG